MKFIEFPDKPSAATKRFGYLIQVGGYTTYHVGVTLESQQKSFIKCLVPVPVLNAATFFKFHRNLEKECATRGIWIPSWYTVEADVEDPRGFTVADQFENPNSNIPARYTEPLYDWSGMLFQAFSYHEVLPKWAKRLLQDCNGCGYVFLRKLHEQFHPALVRNPDELASTYPTQNPTQDFDSWLAEVTFYYTIQAYLMNVDYNLQHHIVQNTFINHMSQKKAIMEIVERERGLLLMLQQERDILKQCSFQLFVALHLSLLVQGVDPFPVADHFVLHV